MLDVTERIRSIYICNSLKIIHIWSSPSQTSYTFRDHKNRSAIESIMLLREQQESRQFKEEPKGVSIFTISHAICNEKKAKRWKRGTDSNNNQCNEE